MKEEEILENEALPDGDSTPKTETDVEAMEGEREGDPTQDELDYERQALADLAELHREFPETKGAESLTEIKNPLRYAALRDLGLTPTEAYLAARGKPVYDNRGHLGTSVPRAAGMPRGFMPSGELNAARAIFHGMSDAEIQKLYQRVTR